jgi:hypothetical protein
MISVGTIALTLNLWILLQCYIFPIILTTKSDFLFYLRVLDLMIDLLDIYITCYNISHITVFDWTLSTSDHTTPIHCSWVRVAELYTLGSDLTVNTSTVRQRTSTVVAYCCRLYLATSCLPRIWLREVFIEPLPSNEYMRHSINRLTFITELQCVSIF